MIFRFFNFFITNLYKRFCYLILFIEYVEYIETSDSFYYGYSSDVSIDSYDYEN